MVNFNIKNSFDNINDYYDFKCHLLKNSFKKCIHIGYIIIVLLLILLYLDVFYFKFYTLENPSYVRLFSIHFLGLFFCILLNIIYHKIYYKITVHNTKYLTPILSAFIMIWGSFVCISTYISTKSIITYIIFQFIFIGILYIEPITTILFHSILFIIMSIAVYKFNIPMTIKSYNLVNIFFTFTFSLSLALTSFKYILKDYLSTLKLKENNKDLIKLENDRTNFFTNISHELRTPLNIIYTSQQLLNSEFENPDIDREKILNYLKITKQNTYRLTRLINNLLDITKLDGGLLPLNKTNVNIVKIVEDIITSASDYIKNKGLNIIFDTSTEEKYISCDVDAIERIVLNLLSNSIKFTPAGGSIFVKVCCNSDFVEISIKDTGIGIEKDMVDTIFERFVQVDKTISRHNEGSGIGLSLVKSLVALHDGKIELITEKNKGSEFIIYLPDVLEENTDIVQSLNTNDQIQITNIEFSDIYY